MTRWKDWIVENQMVRPYADDNAVSCTCEDYDQGLIDDHCPLHRDEENHDGS